MCGIIAVVRRPSDRPEPTADEVLTPLREALALVIDRVAGGAPSIEQLEQTTQLVAAVNLLLRPATGMTALLGNPELSFEVETVIEALNAEILEIDGVLDAGFTGADLELEQLNAAMIDLKDAVWSVARDRLRAAREVAALSNGDVSPAGAVALFSLHQALSAIELGFTLAVAVGYPDLVSISNTSLNQTGRAIECISLVMACYLTLSLLTAAFMNAYNKRSLLKER